MHRHYDAVNVETLTNYHALTPWCRQCRIPDELSCTDTMMPSMSKPWRIIVHWHNDALNFDILTNYLSCTDTMIPAVSALIKTPLQFHCPRAVEKSPGAHNPCFYDRTHSKVRYLILPRPPTVRKWWYTTWSPEASGCLGNFGPQNAS